MDFGSEFVYGYSDSEEEVYSDQELDAGLLGPQEVETFLEKHAKTKGAPEKNAVLRTEKKSDSEVKRGKKKLRKARRADTNVICVKFGHLISPSNMHTGDPVYCSGCAAVLSNISVISSEGVTKHWTCEFCDVDNVIDMEDEEKPKVADVTFMLKPAPVTSSSGCLGVDQTVVVFCIDISGSMCVTTEIPGKHSLRGNHLDHLQSLNTDHERQFLPGQRRNVTFVSRLQSVQAAVDSQLGNMVNEHPDRRVAVVTFNNEVTVVGVGSTEDMHFSGYKLQNKEEMIAAGQKMSMPEAVVTTQKMLTDKLYSLEEGGQTALGPALLLSVAMASQVKGSKVVICTDGMANTGLGNLDVKDEEQFAVASEFYDDVSQLARDNGVTISVITIKGTECKLAELGKVSANTGGQVNIVDPLKLTEEFGNILADSVIATNVQATIILHKGLYIRNEGSFNSNVVRKIGNVTKDTEITFEYGIKKSYRKLKTEKGLAETREEMPPTNNADDNGQGSGEGAVGGDDKKHNLSDLKQLPFQLQLVYTDMEGGEAMRVLTQMKPITSDRKLAEKEMNAGLIRVHGVKQTAALALDGRYTDSRVQALAYRNILYNNLFSEENNHALDQYLCTAVKVEKSTRNIQQTEREQYGVTLSDSDEEVPVEPAQRSARGRRNLLHKKKARRTMACPDVFAAQLYEVQSASSSKSRKQDPE